MYKILKIGMKHDEFYFSRTLGSFATLPELSFGVIIVGFRLPVKVVKEDREKLSRCKQ